MGMGIGREGRPTTTIKNKGGWWHCHLGVGSDYECRCVLLNVGAWCVEEVSPGLCPIPFECAFRSVLRRHSECVPISDAVSLSIYLPLSLSLL